VVFDWNEITVEAINRRAELRRQKWMIRRRELELVAARNFVRPPRVNLLSSTTNASVSELEKFC
jgi:hypothetical protein